MSTMLKLTEVIADKSGRIGASWYRFFAYIERLIGSVGSTAGTGLTTNAAGQLTVASNGISDVMLRDSIALSVIGRPLNSVGDPQDIQAGANGHVLQRDADLLVFRAPRLPSYTIATLPNATGVGDATMAFATNGRKVGQGVGAGTGIPVYADGGVWYRFGDDTVAAA